MYSIILSTADPSQLTRDAARVTTSHLSAEAAVNLGYIWAVRLARTWAVNVCLTDAAGRPLCVWSAGQRLLNAAPLPLDLHAALHALTLVDGAVASNPVR